MDSQTEQSDSTLQETQQPSEQDQAQEAVQPDQPQPDQPDLSSDEASSPEDNENIVKADSVDTESGAEEGQEEVQTSEEVEPEPPTEVEPAVIEAVEYGDLQDVASALDTMSPEIRAHVEPVMNLIQTAHEDYKSAVNKYDEARKELHEFAAELKDYGVESEQVVEKFESQQKQIRVLNSACVDTTWTAFSRLHPEYPGQTEKTKNIFSDVVGSMLDKFPGASTLDKLEEAYKYARYTAGERGEATPEAPAKKGEASKPSTAEAVAPVNVNSKQQALVTDGTTPLSNPVLDVDDMSWNEILNRHLHLL